MSKKTIAVLGAGPGLGNHIGKEFGNHGFRVVLLARREDALKQYVRELAESGIESDYHVVDCSDNDSIQSALSEISQKYGGIPEYYGILNAVSLGMPKKPNEPREITAKIHYESFKE